MLAYQVALQMVIGGPFAVLLVIVFEGAGFTGSLAHVVAGATGTVLAWLPAALVVRARIERADAAALAEHYRATFRRDVESLRRRAASG